MSNVPTQQKWADHNQFYRNLSLQDQEQSISSDRAFTDSTTIVADDGVGDHLNPEGRVTKPARRRSRVSKKTHNVTMVNTDIANFRSMVQQFTGGTIPEVVFPFAPAAATSQFPVNPSSSNGYQIFENQQQQLLQQQQQQDQQYRYSLYR